MNRGQRIGPKNKGREECGGPGTKKQINPRRVLECRNEKADTYGPSLPHVITINGFQVLLSSITCLPSYPTQGRYLPYSSLPSMHGSFNQQVTLKIPIPFLVLLSRI